MSFWSENSGVVGGDNLTIMLTTDGQTYTEVMSNPNGGCIKYIHQVSSNVFLAGGWDYENNGILFRSQDRCETWNTVNINTSDDVFHITSLGETVLIATKGSSHCLRSDDGGVSFYYLNTPTNNGVNGFKIISNDLIFMYKGVELYSSTDSCATWTLEHETDDTIRDMYVDTTNHISWLTGRNGIVSYNSSFLVSIDPINQQVPNGYVLNQNYPNPFNPNTTVEYSIPADGMCTLTIYDFRGKEIKTVVNEFQSAGTHRVAIDGSNLPSGAYIYKLQSGGISLSHKMLLVK
ncbi:MAG: T9SS type A sorting domain-containing protein [Candidatus Komeilibacteria bacterium]